MDKNILYDLILIGDSSEGLSILNQIQEKAKDLNIALVSDSDNIFSHKIEGINLIQAKVIFSEFRYGLVILTLQNRTQLCGKNIIVATGESAIPLVVNKKKNIPNLYYKSTDLPKIKKDSQIIILGNNKEAVNAALTLSKKAKYVYLCNRNFELNCPKNLQTKLENTDNIAYLANSDILNVNLNKHQELLSVVLKTYDSIHCTFLLAFLGRIPNSSCVPAQLADFTDDKKIKIDSKCLTTKIPNLFAVGTVAAKYTKAAGKRLVDYLLETNNWYK